MNVQSNVQSNDKRALPPAHVPKKYRLFGGALAHQMGMLDHNGSMREHPTVEIAVSKAKQELQFYFVAFAERMDDFKKMIIDQGLVIEKLEKKLAELEPAE